MSSFEGILLRGVPAVLFIGVSSFHGVQIRGVPAVLFIEVSSFHGIQIRGVPAVLFIEVSSFQGIGAWGEWVQGEQCIYVSSCDCGWASGVTPFS